MLKNNVLIPFFFGDFQGKQQKGVLSMLYLFFCVYDSRVRPLL